ncbi:MAG: glycosyltransferase family 2 protein [Fibrobacter sp.]|nr:glycosyltransferase family 2 protein [Fibrobacter sp.]
MNKNYLSIFIPAFNAELHLKSVIKRIPSSLWPFINKVYIINDGSTDKTQKIITELSLSESRIIPVQFGSNRGYGNAVKRGLALCKNDGCEYAACIHADGQYPPEYIPEFVEHMSLNNCDLLQGSRIASGTAISGGMPLYKFIAGKCLTFLENIVFGLKLTDYHSGFLIYSRNVLNKINFEKLSSKFEFDLEVIASSRAKKLTICELPIPTRYADETSYLNPITYGFRVLKVLCKYSLGIYNQE